MQKRKKRAFKEYKEMLQCLWYIGKGIMFRKHLIKYFTIHGQKKSRIEEAIRDLIDSDLIESFRYGSSHILKLKKYGIYTLLEKKSSEVDSVRITGKKILRSAFLNERILNTFTANPLLLKEGFALSLNRAMYSRSHTSFEKRSWEVLNRLRLRDQRNEDKGISKKVLSNTAKSELNDLFLVSEYTRSGKYEEEVRELRIKKENNLDLYAVNLNGLHSRDIYFAFLLREENYFLDLDFIDIQSTMTEKQLETKLKLAIPYMKFLIDPEVQIHVNVLVACETRQEYFKSRLSRITKNFSQTTKINDIEMKIINLNLEKTLFAGMTIIS